MDQNRKDIINKTYYLILKWTSPKHAIAKLPNVQKPIATASPLNNTVESTAIVLAVRTMIYTMYSLPYSACKFPSSTSESSFEASYCQR
jgi:hypothetical protein